MTDSPAQVESPRLWYSVGSLSHAGTLMSASASAITGVYGKLVAGSSAGNVFVPAYSAGSKTLPAASR